MPELPEVETVRRALIKDIIGKKIIRIEARYPKIIENDLDDFISKVLNKSFTSIERLGKYLIFYLTDGAIISHLRMEGKYFYIKEAEISDKHIHIIFHLDNGMMLCYQDVRKFGRMVYKENADVYSTYPLNEIGVEPISEKTFDISKIYAKIKSRKLPIKTVLLDQSIIAGLGNIYVDEVLFACGIMPDRQAKDITLADTQNIMNESKRILNKAIELKGSTIRSYTSSLGVKGGYQDFLLVHTRDVCQCGNKIEKMKIGGRTSYYCRVCQK